MSKSSTAKPFLTMLIFVISGILSVAASQCFGGPLKWLQKQVTSISCRTSLVENSRKIADKTFNRPTPESKAEMSYRDPEVDFKLMRDVHSKQTRSLGDSFLNAEERQEFSNLVSQAISTVDPDEQIKVLEALCKFYDRPVARLRAEGAAARRNAENTLWSRMNYLHSSMLSKLMADPNLAWADIQKFSNVPISDSNGVMDAHRQLLDKYAESDKAVAQFNSARFYWAYIGLRIYKTAHGSSSNFYIPTGLIIYLGGEYARQWLLDHSVQYTDLKYIHRDNIHSRYQTEDSLAISSSDASPFNTWVKSNFDAKTGKPLNLIYLPIELSRKRAAAGNDDGLTYFGPELLAKLDFLTNPILAHELEHRKLELMLRAGEDSPWLGKISPYDLIQSTLGSRMTVLPGNPDGSYGKTGYSLGEVISFLRETEKSLSEFIAGREDSKNVWLAAHFGHEISNSVSLSGTDMLTMYSAIKSMVASQPDALLEKKGWIGISSLISNDYLPTRALVSGPLTLGARVVKSLFKKESNYAVVAIRMPQFTFEFPIFGEENLARIADTETRTGLNGITSHPTTLNLFTNEVNALAIRGHLFVNIGGLAASHFNALKNVVPVEGRHFSQLPIIEQQAISAAAGTFKKFADPILNNLASWH
jgi:hypothetical protein